MLVGIGKPASASDAVDALLECHARIRHFIDVVRKIAQGDAPAEDIVDACSRCERYFTEGLPLHIEDEEQSIEPRLRGLRDDVDEALSSMQRQHGEHDELLRSIVERLEVVRTSPQADATLADLAQRFAQLMDEHLEIEESVIFPALRELLPREAQLEIAAEVRARRR